MSNLHANLDEANKHTPKGFDNAATNTRPWKDESNQSTYTDNETLPRALNFVDGTTAPPTTTNGHIYVITGTGTVNAGWGSASFNDWVRFANGFPVSISPVTGYLCYDITASQWMEFDGTTWAAFGGGGVVNTIFTGGTMSTPSIIAMAGNDLTFDGGKTTLKGAGSTSATTALLVQNSLGNNFLEVKDDGSTTLNSLATQVLRVSRSGATLFQVGSATTDQVNIPKTILIGASSTTNFGPTLDVFGQSGVDVVSFRTIGGGTVAQRIDSSGSTGFHEATTAIDPNSIVTISAGGSATKAPLCIFPTSATRASSVTATDGQMIYVNSTDATFASVGFWGRENGTWVKL